MINSIAQTAVAAVARQLETEDQLHRDLTGRWNHQATKIRQHGGTAPNAYYTGHQSVGQAPTRWVNAADDWTTWGMIDSLNRVVGLIFLGATPSWDVIVVIPQCECAGEPHLADCPMYIPSTYAGTDAADKITPYAGPDAPKYPPSLNLPTPEPYTGPDATAVTKEN